MIAGATILRTRILSSRPTVQTLPFPGPSPLIAHLLLYSTYCFLCYK